MADKLMYIPNDDNPSVDYNQQLTRFDIQLNATSNENSIKLTKVVKPTNKKNVITKPWGLE